MWKWYVRIMCEDVIKCDDMSMHMKEWWLYWEWWWYDVNGVIWNVSVIMWDMLMGVNDYE